MFFIKELLTFLQAAPVLLKIDVGHIDFVASVFWRLSGVAGANI